MGQTNLSDLQLAVMHVLWSESEATAARVQEALRPDRDLAMSTVSTVLSRLVDRGAVTYREQGRGYLYRPSISRQAVRRSMVSDMIENVFRGDTRALVSHLLEEAEIDAAELRELQQLVDNMEEENDD